MAKAKLKRVRVTSAPLRKHLDDGSAEFKELAKRRLAQLDIAQDLIRRRKELGLSQAELAKRAGLTQPLISRVESGDFKNFEIQTLIRIATALNARYDFLLVIEPQEPDASSPSKSAKAAARM